MKKMKRISAVLLLAAGFALAFGGCSNTKDETGTEQGGGAGSGGETGGTGGTENPGDSGSSGDNTGGNGGTAGSDGNDASGGQTGGSGDTSGSGSGNNSGNTGNAGDSGTSSGGDAETNKKIMSLDDLSGGWDAEYDAKTKTITLTKDYGAKGWGYYNGNLDVSGYSKFSVVFDKVESADPWVQVVVKYSAENGDDTSADGKFENGQFSNGSNILTVELEKTSVFQLSIQGKNSGDKITIKEVYFE